MKKHIPNFITILNLLSGIFAILAAFQNDLEWAAYFIILAAVLDFLDGRFALWLRAQSDFGKQLDSLADMVSFGLAPGIILFFLLQQSVPLANLASPQKNMLSYLAFLMSVFSALRLAKFNIDTRQSENFIGLPSPANALLIASFALVNKHILSKDGFLTSLTGNTFFLLIVLSVSCFLLVANIPLLSLKFVSFKWKENKIRYILIGVSLLLLFIYKIAAIPLIIVLYIMLSLFYFSYKRKLR